MSLRPHQQALIEEVITKFTNLMNTETITIILDSQREFNRSLADLCKERFRQLRGQLEETGESGLLTAEKAVLRCDVEKLKKDLDIARRELAVRKDLVESFRNNSDRLRHAFHDSRPERRMPESKLEAAGEEVAFEGALDLAWGLSCSRAFRDQLRRSGDVVPCLGRPRL